MVFKKIQLEKKSSFDVVSDFPPGKARSRPKAKKPEEKDQAPGSLTKQIDGVLPIDGSHKGGVRAEEREGRRELG